MGSPSPTPDDHHPQPAIFGQPGMVSPVPLAEVVDTDSSEPVTRAFAAAPPPSQPLPTHFGRYRIDRLLNQGGMGTIYLAHDPEAGRAVALKVPRFGPGDAVAVERFLSAARAAATVFHPSLVPILEVGQVEGTAYLTMPYLEGQTLAE